MVCALRRVAGDVGVLVGIRRIVVRIERANSDGDRNVGGGDVIDSSSFVDDDHHVTSIDNRPAHHDVDEYLDHDHCGSIVSQRNACHRPVGARTRHHRVSHG